MQLYRYFKGHEKRGKWHPYEVGSEEERKAFQASRFGFCTVLGMASDEGDPEEWTGRYFYQGPFYLDIDTTGQVKDSLPVAKKAVKRLMKMGVEQQYIDIWLSGKKGFHIVVPQDVFTSDTVVENLPHVYRELAKALGLEQLDWSVYSLKKGRMWRLPSRERSDNAKFKVICTADELLSMTVKDYEDLCAKPSREYEEPPAVKKRNAELETMYRFAKQKAEQTRPLVATLIDDNMRRALGEDKIPPCVQCLKNDENIRDDVGFNHKSVQMMKAVRAFVPPGDQKSELDTFATNSSGDSYGTVESRIDHVRRSFGSVASGTDYSWSCRSILSVLKQAPCDNCPIQFIRWQQEDDSEEEYIRRKTDASGEEGTSVQASAEKQDESGIPQTLTEQVQALQSDYNASQNAPKPTAPPAQGTRGAAPNLVEDASEGLTIHDGCYAFIGKDGFRRVTNFVIRITKVFIEHVPSLNEDRRVAVQAQVFMKGKYVGSVNIEEEAWNSNAAFTGAFNGIGNLTFIGKDEDVRRMKSSLLTDVEKKATNIRRVHSYGIHHGKIADQDVFTYVEPGWSIDNFGNTNLYALAGKMTGAPRLQFVTGLKEGVNDPKLTECFKQLFAINQKTTIAALLGWNMASFLKQHVFAYRNEFPLVSLWGNAEAGKTQTSGLFAALHGIHYLGSSGENAAPISLGGAGASAFALWTTLSESMTIPKLAEEFNLRSLKNKYEEYAEHFKKVYNQHAIKRGTIRHSKMHGAGSIDAYTVDIPLTAPTLLISEQSIQIPALVQRCIQIQMNEDQRRGPGMEQAFHHLKRHYTYFDTFAKTAYMEAVNIPVTQVEEWIRSWHDKVPVKIGDRPHFCYCVCLMGLSFLLYLNDKYDLGIGDDVRELSEFLTEMTNMSASEILQRKSQSEADRLMAEFAVMAELSSKDEGYRWLTKGQYYVREGNDLYIDGIAAHAQYLRFAITQQQSAIIATYSQFKELIRYTRYCESVAAVREGFARGRSVMKFNIAKMAERGIEVQCFEET